MNQLIPNLTEIRDQAACSQLISLLNDAQRDCRLLGEEPIVVASCPSKFNDAWNDRDWCAIRVGRFFSQRTEYFARPEEHDERLRAGPESARAASRVLDHLQAGNWRELYQRAFERQDMSLEEVIALVLQDGGTWLVVNGSNSGESAVYSLTADGRLVHVGRCDHYADRFDQGLSAERPLVIRRMEDDATDLAAVARHIETLELGVAYETPDWYRKRRPFWVPAVGTSWPKAQELAKRLTVLAETGRVSAEDYQSLTQLISRILG